MSDTKNTVLLLQGIVTDLSQKADGQIIQSRIFANQGFNKLAAKYTQHTGEERDYVEQCINKIPELEETPEN